jgi:DNA-binding transcriptional regulator GbsR (MarR family)
MNLPPLSQSFVLHFGEMGSRWGINRTVGQIYAVLYVNREALSADDIVEKLGVSRSNVSMGLKELQSWRLVRMEHHPGDRRDFFSAPEDVWQIFKTLAEERQRREVDPTLSMLRDALLEPAGGAEDAYAQERMRKMHELIEQITDWFAEVRKLSPETLQSLMGLGSKVVKLLELKERVLGGRREGAGDAAAQSSTPAPKPGAAA